MFTFLRGLLRRNQKPHQRKTISFLKSRKLNLKKEKEVQSDALPKREELLQRLQSEHFDVVVVGGGVTGTGCALDAVSRGLKTALIEREDFGSGTSSKSTKLLHGGVRYLQEAIKKLDSEQLKMVREALHERKHVLQAAPYLTKKMPLLIPIYSNMELPITYAGIKFYDLASRKSKIRGSTVHLTQVTRDLIPTLNPTGLLGGVLFYDGQVNDTRLTLMLALTAIRYGAVVLNHVEATKIIKNTKEHEESCEPIKITGVCANDKLTGNDFTITTKCLINATGPHTDCFRKLDDRCADEMCTLSSGVHVVLPGCFSPNKVGMVKSSSDDRVIFMLPWLDHTLVGTTETPAGLTFTPRAQEQEVEFLLSDLKKALHPDIKISKNDVLASWSGIRPLVSDSSKVDTKSISRSHLVEISDSNLVTITGGKLTTYRAMAQDAIDAAVNNCCLQAAKPCQTGKILLEGALKWSPTFPFKLMSKYCFDCHTAEHLSEYYGDRAHAVATLAVSGETSKCGSKIFPKKLHPDFPFLEAEVKYAVHEYAFTAVDVLARRLNIALINAVAAFEVLPVVVNIMAKELNWDEEQKQMHYEKGLRFLCKQSRFAKGEKRQFEREKINCEQ